MKSRIAECLVRVSPLLPTTSASAGIHDKLHRQKKGRLVRQIFSFQFLMCLIFLFPQISFAGEELESTITKQIRESSFYEFVGRGDITFSESAKKQLEQFDNNYEASLFF